VRPVRGQTRPPRSALVPPDRIRRSAPIRLLTRVARISPSESNSRIDGVLRTLARRHAVKSATPRTLDSATPPL
jgi:hypothetical protein